MSVTKETYCAQCGKYILTRYSSKYQFKLRDWRKGSPTHGRQLWFCSDGCMRKFEQEQGRKRVNKWDKL